MDYSDKRVVIFGLANVMVLIFLANIFKGKFGIKNEQEVNTVVKEEPFKITEVKEIYLS